MRVIPKFVGKSGKNGRAEQTGNPSASPHGTTGPARTELVQLHEPGAVDIHFLELPKSDGPSGQLRICSSVNHVGEAPQVKQECQFKGLLATALYVACVRCSWLKIL